ncbi:MFS transporter [Candidatus Arthromitus sp. SFB-rat-Yit]|uniref:MFS transporter n=1 Tax=Candidatus Arthromitus sp. SFB-rat-Yit TaxID=1041504 RepID=UPI0002FA703E|nr:MFS transporter [Candidatus Arthromitus sp. SFB-rat-Yit]
MDKYNKQFVKISILNLIIYIALNMAHPVTPKLINENYLPTFYFGLLTGCFNLSTFITSPTFGVICNIYGKKIPMIISLIGYTIGQIVFGFFPNSINVLIARIISGIFIAGYFVSSMSYVSSITPNDLKLKRFSYFNASNSLGMIIGSLIGGNLGVTNYRLTFIVQIIICVFSIILIIIFFKDNTIKNNDLKFKFKILNFKYLKEIKKSNKFTYLILIIMILTFLSIQGYLSTISYYVEDVLNLPTSINGLILGSTGAFTIITNLLIIPIIVKKFNSKSIYMFAILLCGSSIIISMLTKNQYITSIFLLIFIATQTLITPTIQSVLLENSNQNHSELLGLQNGFKAIGSFLGSILSGLLFNVWFKLPFILVGISLILSFIILKSFKEKRLRL